MLGRRSVSREAGNVVPMRDVPIEYATRIRAPGPRQGGVFSLDLLDIARNENMNIGSIGKRLDGDGLEPTLAERGVGEWGITDLTWLGWRVLLVELPPHDEPISSDHAVNHALVVAPVEVVHILCYGHAQLGEIDTGVPRHKGIIRPIHDLDTRREQTRPLIFLEPATNVPIAVGLPHGEHMRPMTRCAVLPSCDAIHEAHQFSGNVKSACRDAPNFLRDHQHRRWYEFTKTAAPCVLLKRGALAKLIQCLQVANLDVQRSLLVGAALAATAYVADRCWGRSGKREGVLGCRPAILREDAYIRINLIRATLRLLIGVLDAEGERSTIRIGDRLGALPMARSSLEGTKRAHALPGSNRPPIFLKIHLFEAGGESNTTAQHALPSIGP